MIRVINNHFFKDQPLIIFHGSLVIAFLSSLYFVATQDLPYKGEVGIPATILGFFFRDQLSDPNFFNGSRYLWYIFGSLWCLNVLPRVSATIAGLSYLWFSSMLFENSPGAEIHSVHMYPMMILLYMAFYLFYGKETQKCFHPKKGIDLNVTGPRWGLELIVYTIGISHSWAGISKIMDSGLNWANGVSLQLWVYLWGLDNFMNDLVINYTTFAKFSQWSVLIVESSAVIAFFLRGKSRFLAGVLLVSFHLVNQYMWGWNFLYWCPSILICYAGDVLEPNLERIFSQGKKTK